MENAQLPGDVKAPTEEGGLIYRLISQAQKEFKSYSQELLQQSKQEIFQSSAETAAKENLLCSLIHDSYEFEDSDLQSILGQEKPLDTLYHFLLKCDGGISTEDSISHILAEYNDQIPAMEQGVTMC